MSQLSVKYNNISILTKQHRHISKFFNTHQKMLMHGDICRAIDRLEELKKYVKDHMKAENDYLIPLYEKYIFPIPIGGAVEFFIHEHHKINRFIDDFSEASIKVTKNSNMSKIDLVDLFDKHYQFKHLLDHHHTREDTFLFRLLDRVLEEKIKNEVLKHFDFDYV